MPLTRTLIAAAIVLALAGLAVLAPGPTSTAQATLLVEDLGTPFTTGLYARNVWDMQLYDGRIFLGHGNSSNSGPDTNAGPIPIWAYDLATRSFVREFLSNEEQIDIFRVIDGVLHTPGHDPREGSEFGNYYRRNGATWSKVRTIPSVIHTYDLALHDGKLFAANGTLTNNTVTVSSDGGQTWTTLLPAAGRTYELFQFQGDLYAMQWILVNDTPAETHIFRYEGGTLVNIQVAGRRIVPGQPSNSYARMVRTTEFAGQLVYIGSEYGVNDHQWTPFGLYVAPSFDRARRVTLPETTALPYDILLRGETLYLLASTPVAQGQHQVIVYSTRDLATWTEQFRFTASTFARSFEEAEGVFYIGLGSETSPVAGATGSILRVSTIGATPTATRTATPTATRTSISTIGTTPTATRTATRTATHTATRTATALPSKAPRQRIFLPGLFQRQPFSRTPSAR